MSNAAKKTPVQGTDSTHYLVAKSSSGSEDKLYLNFFTNSGQYGDMISSTIKEGIGLEKFVELADFIVKEVEAGNKVYLNFNGRKES